MGSVDVDFVLSKLCAYGDELWVAGGGEGVSVYNADLRLIKPITNKHFQSVNSVCKTDTEVIACDDQTGLHVLNLRGDYVKQICSGQFSDASVTNNILFALEFRKRQIHAFSKPAKSWVQDRELL